MVSNKEKLLRQRLRENNKGKDELAVAGLEAKKPVTLFMLITGSVTGDDPTVNFTWM